MPWIWFFVVFGAAGVFASFVGAFVYFLTARNYYKALAVKGGAQDD